jgi:hypothetical protein
VNTFSVLFKCLPFFGCVGFGLYFLLIGLIPSWREKGWNHWKLYDTYPLNHPKNSSSWLVQLGFAKPTKPIAEGDFSEKQAVTLSLIFGTLFVLIGLGGLCLIVYLTIH